MKSSHIRYPIIPTNIIIHLGKPEEAAKNIKITFVEYIKNVASSEIYPTWPQEALESNILAIISFTLNRIYNEWYHSKGYDFDITSLKEYDQTFIEDREIFDRIAKIVDKNFNNYIVKDDQIQPLFASYCDGKTTTCQGLSQVGSATLAETGKNVEDILKTYYGENIRIIHNAQVGEFIESYPGYEVKEGIAGDMVRVIQTELIRIIKNYPAIPNIPKVNGIYNIETKQAVEKFQEIFNLNKNGIVDKQTWYKIKYIYNAVKKVNDLYSEGIEVEEVNLKYPDKLSYSDTGLFVRVLHYYLGLISFFDENLPQLEVNGIYNNNTKQMVINFQNKYNLPVTGEVDKETWIKLKEVYHMTIKNIPEKYLKYEKELYPGKFLTKGMKGEDIEILQGYLFEICKKYKDIPGVIVNGVFDELTEQSVLKIQKIYKQEQNGAVGPITWYNIVNRSKE